MRRIHLLFAALVAMILFAWFSGRGSAARINTIHCINLDSATERWSAMQAASASCPLKIQRWRATYGPDLSVDDLYKEGVGYAIIAKGSGPYRDQLKEKRNLGVAGCFISHRRLMTHLASLPFAAGDGHLILEDDVDLPHGFLGPDHEWHTLVKHVPHDWDVLYLGMTHQIGDPVNSHVVRLHNRAGYNKGNWGMFGYLVRHGALEKILPHLTYMNDALDNQFSRVYDCCNVYAFKKMVVPLNKELNAKSTITTIA